MTSENQPVLRLEGIHQHFGKHHVLKGVDLTVKHGEVIVLIGASGSGKTSLLRCVNLLNIPDSGRIVIDGDTIFERDTSGKDSRRLSPAETNRIRVKTGMVFQQFNLFPHMTVLHNVMEGPVIVKGLPRDTVEAEARTILTKMGLGDHLLKKPSQLSGGQQQRVAIARALAMNPKIMLFDEPTSALDPELVGEVLKAMLELARSGMTMMIVSHEMGFAFEIADRIIFLDQGRIAVDGAPAEVLLNPTHDRLKSFVGRFHESAEMLRPFLEAKLLASRQPA